MAQPWVCTTAAQNTSRMRAATGTRVLCSAAQTIAVKPTKATSEPWAHSSARSAAQEVDHRRSKGRCRKEACRRYQTRGIEHATWAIRPKPLYSLLPWRRGRLWGRPRWGRKSWRWEGPWRDKKKHASLLGGSWRCETPNAHSCMEEMLCQIRGAPPQPPARETKGAQRQVWGRFGCWLFTPWSCKDAKGKGASRRHEAFLASEPRTTFEDLPRSWTNPKARTLQPGWLERKEAKRREKRGRSQPAGKTGRAAPALRRKAEDDDCWGTWKPGGQERQEEGTKPMSGEAGMAAGSDGTTEVGMQAADETTPGRSWSECLTEPANLQSSLISFGFNLTCMWKTWGSDWSKGGEAGRSPGIFFGVWWPVNRTTRTNIEVTASLFG